MTERPGRLLTWLFGRFFRHVEFPDELAEEIRRLAARGQIVYVCRHLSFVNYLYLTFALAARGLPLAGFANGVHTVFYTLFVQPLGRIVNTLFSAWRQRQRDHLGELARTLRGGRAALLFLRRPTTLFGLEPSGFRGPYFETLLALGRELPRPIYLVPLEVVWGSQPVRAGVSRRGLVDLVFGEKEAPGRVRALLQLLGGGRVLGARPIELGAFRAEAGEGSDELLARKLRWQLAGRLESELRVALGPPRKGADRIREEVLRARRLNDEARRIAREEGLDPGQVERRARAALAEIAADPKPWAVDLLRIILKRVWRRIFDGFDVDQEGLERVREAARKGPLILVPSHRSHIDYLVLSYVFVDNDLVPPHIAAGANLSFFPLGTVFRRAGAFFLRRSFKGDRLYTAVFRAYLKKLLREGHSIEFFIEGGRSRTGKLLAPKLGLLGMIADAALDDDGARARRAQVVPISIGYEKVIEDRSYAAELRGGQKKKEDVRGLLRATRVLRASYGRLNIQFGEPFALGEALRDLGALAAWDEEANVVVPADEDARRHAIQRLSHQIMWGINRVTAVTPTALTAAALLGAERRGLPRVELLANAGFLLERARAAGGRVSQALLDEVSGGLNPDALDRALDLLQRDGDVEMRAGSGVSRAGFHPADAIYAVPDERRPRLAFYRNNCVHLFVAEALVAQALIATAAGGAEAERRVGRRLLYERTLTLSRLLKLEFTYRVGEPFERIFERTVADLVRAGLLAEARSDDGQPLLVDRAPTRMALLAGQVRDFVEAYWIAAAAIAALDEPLAERDLVRLIHERGEDLYYTGEVKRREACLDANYKNAVACFVERGLLAPTDEGRLKRTEAPVPVAEIRALVG